MSLAWHAQGNAKHNSHRITKGHEEGGGPETRGYHPVHCSVVGERLINVIVFGQAGQVQGNAHHKHRKKDVFPNWINFNW